MVGGEQIDQVLVEMQYEINKPGNQSSDDLRGKEPAASIYEPAPGRTGRGN
jgi:hypothetical protein